jgi:hypothetical protein
MKPKEQSAPVPMAMPRVLNREIVQLVGEARRHAREIYGDDSIIAANRILALWLWHAVRGSSPTFLEKTPKRRRRNGIETMGAR